MSPDGEAPLTAYYNENDEFAAAWLRELIRAGHIAPGHVDTRSIEDVRPDDLRGFTQHHFFAGIGVWSHALRAAGWPDERPVWTGSCPCQPFSAAGKRGGAADKRHLWPDWFRLIRECGPATVFGEQVEGAVRLGWLDLVFGDLEAEGYACGAVVFGAHSVGAPHIRQRLYWVAGADLEARGGRGVQRPGQGDGEGAWSARERPAGLRADGRLADADGGLARDGDIQRGGQHGQQPEDSGAGERLADPGGPRLEGRDGRTLGNERATAERSGGLERVGDANEPRRGVGPERDGKSKRGQDGTRRADAPGPGVNRWPSATAGFWRDPDWLACRDGKWRPVESFAFPLVDGAPARVGRLRGYGNGLVAPQAAAFVRAYMTRP